MSTADQPLAPMLAKLKARVKLSLDDEAAVLALPFARKAMRAGDFIAREGDSPTRACVLLDGFAYRHKIAGDGGRQIFSIHMKGDMVDLQGSLLAYADHNLQALTPIDAAFIPITAINKITDERPIVSRAMWLETLIEGSIFREWTLNVGRRDGRTRTAHLLCEFALRLEMAGLGKKSQYSLPMTQEQLSDALALTPIHVNRVLRSLEADGYIDRDKRSVRIEDWQRLAQVGDFDNRYLHLDRIDTGR